MIANFYPRLILASGYCCCLGLSVCPSVHPWSPCWGWKFYTKTNDKREAFNFEIVNYPDLSGSIPEWTAYDIYISQVIRYAKCLTKPRISLTESDYSSTNSARNTSPKNGCWQPWRNAAERTPRLWKKLPWDEQSFGRWLLGRWYMKLVPWFKPNNQCVSSWLKTPHLQY